MDLLGNKTLLHGFKRSWFAICGFQSVLCVSLFQGSLLVIVIMIAIMMAGKNTIVKVAFELKSSHVCDRCSKASVQSVRPLDQAGSMSS